MKKIPSPFELHVRSIPRKIRETVKELAEIYRLELKGVIPTEDREDKRKFIALLKKAEKQYGKAAIDKLWENERPEIVGENPQLEILEGRVRILEKKLGISEWEYQFDD